MANLLVVDDERGIRDLLWEILNDEGHHVELAENAAQARVARLQSCPDLVLLDIWMPDTDGVTLLKEWSVANLLTMPVIMMSGHATIDTAVEATKIGALAFLEKPITLQKLLKTVAQGLKHGPHPHRGIAALPLADAQAPPGALATPPEQPEVNPSAATPLQLQKTALSEQSFALDRPLREARDEFEKAYFEYHLRKENGSMPRVANKTGLERTHLYRKLKQLGLGPVNSQDTSAKAGKEVAAQGEGQADPNASQTLAGRLQRE